AIPKTLEAAYLSVTAGRFDRYLLGKMATLFIRNLDVSPAMAASPPEKGIFRFLIDRTRERSIPSKKLTGLYSSSSILTILHDTSNPGTRTQAGTAGKLGPYGPVNPKRSGYINEEVCELNNHHSISSSASEEKLCGVPLFRALSSFSFSHSSCLRSNSS